jgi:transcription initiation factor TFIIB
MSSVATSQQSCPDCGGSLIHESEVFCTDCGLVQEVQQIDQGPEWREFTDKDQEKRRTGPTLSEGRHDRGLSAKMGADRSDQYGNTFSHEKRKKLGRLRMRDRRSRTGDSADQTLIYGFQEIKRMQCSMGLPDSLKDQACSLFRSVQDEDLLHGSSIEGMASASLFAAIRCSQHLERPMSEVATVSKISQSHLQTCYNKINTELGLPTPPPQPIHHLPKIISDVDASEAVRREAKEILGDLGGTEHAGADAAAIAAASVHVAAENQGGQITQRSIADAADVTAYTIRNHRDGVLADYFDG